MKIILKDCYERELKGLDPYDGASFPSCRGLLMRGMIIIAPRILKNGKRVMGVELTATAIRYLTGDTYQGQ